jgi:pyruvate,water dikinase
MKEAKVDFIKWFSEADKTSGKVVGGKGANLSEIYNLNVPVPPGFTITAQAYDYFIKRAGLNEGIKELLGKIDYEDTKQLNETTKEIRELILDAEFPREMEEEIFEAYENLDVKDLKAKGGTTALGILKSSSEPLFVAVRSSATTEDLATASFAGQQDSFVNIKGRANLIEHIKKCFASLFTARATYYRNKKGFKYEEASLAVVIQKMVDSDKSGVIFSQDPTHKKDNVVMEAVWGLGEGIVSGRITPDNYIISKDFEILKKDIKEKKIAITRDSSGEKQTIKLNEERSKRQVLKDHEIIKLAEIAKQLEDHYQKPQDIEFAIEGTDIFIVQTRPITTMEGRIETAKEIKGEPILTGLAASPGIASGKIKIINDLADLDKITKGDILVTKMTNPDMVVTMQKSAAIVTDEGGVTAHAAIVSREMGIPCIVGTQEATTKLKEGEIITVNGSTGKVYKGKVAESVQKEVLPVTANTKTEIKVMVDLPSFAERAAKSGIKKVGLTRMEGIIAESGKHPEYFLQQNNISEYEELIFKGIKQIAQYFDELWIRTSDIRTDEFQNLEGAPKEKEANPMLGMHGIRYGIKNPEILMSELRALKRVAEHDKKIGILMPQVISVDELKKVKEFLAEINFPQLQIGIMVETPASVQLIKEFCEEKIDFISFGTNDLTQYMLALDRGNEQVQHLYNEMHPAILYQLEYVIRVCKRNNVKTSICGQAGSKKEMVKFLVERGIDSISVNADVAKDIADYVAELEKEQGEEPRQYQPENPIKTNEIEKSKEEFVKPQNTEIQTPQEETKEIEKPREEFVKPQMEFNPGTKSYEPNIEKPMEKVEPQEEYKKDPVKEQQQNYREGYPHINGMSTQQDNLEEREKTPEFKTEEEITSHESNSENYNNAYTENYSQENTEEKPEEDKTDEILDIF